MKSKHDEVKRRRTRRRRLRFERLSSTEFEQFVSELLDALDFVNVDWRKGTGKRTSPADRGRDIICDEIRRGPDGHVRLDRWFVDCKHSVAGVPPRELQNLLSWSEAEAPDTALFVVSNFLSNGAKDFIENYRASRRPPFKIRVWERPTLEKLAAPKVALLRRHDLIDERVRNTAAIAKAEQEFFDKLWYARHRLVVRISQRDKGSIRPDIMRLARAAAKQVERKYGKRALGPYTDFEFGMLNGKLSALRWVLGDDWDFLDT